MLDKAISEGRTNITFLTGVGGAGKSTALRNNKDIDLSNEGIVYDSAFNSYSSLAKKLEYAQQKGMKNVTVIAVHNDALTAFKNTVYRGEQTGRFLSLQYFVDDAFVDNAGKIKLLLHDHPEVNLIAIDNSGNNGGKIISKEEASKWSYTIDEELMYNLLKFIENEHKEERLTKEQISSVGRDILEIKKLNSARVQQIANRINNEASRNGRNEEGRERSAGLGINPDTVSKVVDENGEPLVVWHYTDLVINDYLCNEKHNTK